MVSSINFYNFLLTSSQRIIQPSRSRLQAFWSDVSVPLDHGEGFPASQLLQLVIGVPA
jgi:hypothetical protein